MKIVCVPLDIRPYNYQFLIDIASFNSKVDIIMPNKKILGKKKIGADLEHLNLFINKKCIDADALIISLDMFLYGGLFPARIHNQDNEVFLKQFDVLKSIKVLNPKLKIYCSSLILRTPAYNSSLEEPNYYEKYGLDIYNYGILKDKVNSGIIKDDFELKSLENKIPLEYLKDYLNRRSMNLNNTLSAIDYVNQGIFETLIIPQDDASKYGHGASDQKKIYNYINELSLFDKIYLHPGTDESGCTLLTRAYTDYYSTVNIKCEYVVDCFKDFTPLFEDRRFESSLISHTQAMGINIDDTDYDFILGINGVSSVMHEASHVYFNTTRIGEPIDIKGIDLSYYRDRNFSYFCKRLKKHKTKNIPIGILDASFCNGGEFEFVKELDKNDLIDYISGYSGWNTVCNSLGTILATMVFSLNADNKQKCEEFKVCRFINDLIYCSDVGVRVNRDYLVTIGAKYDDFKNQDEKIMNYIKNEVQMGYNNLFGNYDKNYNIVSVNAPFNRLTGLEFMIQKED